MLEVLLRGAGYKVHVASDALSASDLLRVAAIDLVLTAATVHPISGAELAAFATQLRPRVKVMVMTASGQNIPLRQGWNLIAKPFSTADLLQRVQGLLV